MAEFAFLNLDRESFEPLWRAASRRDPAAMAQLKEFWSQYDNLDLLCFLCDSPVTSTPVTAQVLPDIERADRFLGAPLCAKCWAIAPMKRLHLCLKLLKRIKRKPGRTIAFSFGPKRQPHPR